MSGDSVPLSRRLARISTFIAIPTAGIAAFGWPPAGKSYQEAPACAGTALFDGFRHVEAACLAS